MTIWSVDKQPDQEASWLGDKKEQLGVVGHMEDIVVSLDNMSAGILKKANWKTLRLDGVRFFLFKKFWSLHSPIT